ncbi:TlpA disulfide reductase family protein [Alteromonas sp. C1M14]|uniref:TlpA family protein disulfide reductase n=1 Tax=Alteromonas sp. C1M14 TaxID=2841567 RepID=UPI001C08B3D4|nr:TlpA disulfide reductase family protein [Alteromonas sp. C1M14]MBU2976790.1 TlpA family protein disulfide reductase [Alteromonas sp. C1M14]
MTKQKNKQGRLAHRFGWFLFAVLSVGAGVLSYTLLKPDAYTLQGNKVNWRNDHQQWRIINFFAPWCAPCLREIPALNKLATQLDDKVKIYGVSFDPKTPGELNTLVNTLNIHFDVIVVNDDTKFPMPYPAYLPATYLISPQGEVKASLYGEQGEKSIEQALAKHGI